MWRSWETYISSLDIADPYLQHLDTGQQLSLLKVYAIRVRRGDLSASGDPVSAQRVQDYIRTAAQEISRLGSKLDPRLTLNNVMHMDLTNIKRAHAKEDPPPEKTKPIPISLVKHACERLMASGDIINFCKANLMIIGFFWILRPGEYTYDPENNHPFRLQDSTFETPQGPINGALGAIRLMCFHIKTLLNFTDQKNGIRDEAISHGNTEDPLLCPGKATFRQVVHLRLNNAPPDTPLHTVYAPTGIYHITASDITRELRQSCQEIGHKLGIHPSDISARALRAGGATALLRAGVSPLNARLMGRWRSWAMIEYLHNSVMDTSKFATKMLRHGEFVIPPHQKLPADVLTMVRPYLEEHAPHNIPVLCTAP